MENRESACRPHRHARRHGTLYPCHMVRERDGAVISNVAFDLSSAGMQVLTDSRVLTGEPIQVTFRAPETGAWLTLHGTVARVLHGRRPNEWGRRLGVEFEDVGAQARARLHVANLLLERKSTLPGFGI